MSEGFGVGEGVGVSEVGVDDGVGDVEDLVGVGLGVVLGDVVGDGGVVVGVADGVLGVALGRLADGAVGVFCVVSLTWPGWVCSVVGPVVLALGVPVVLLGCGPTSTVGGVSSPAWRRARPAPTTAARTSAAAAAIIAVRRRAG